MDPSTGRFITMDPYAGSIFDPTSLHKYLYANANPVMYSDPSGYNSLGELIVTEAINTILDSAFCGVAGGIFNLLDSLLGGETDPDVLMNSFIAGFKSGFMFGLGVSLGRFFLPLKIFMMCKSLQYILEGFEGAIESFENGNIYQGIYRAALSVLGGKALGRYARDAFTNTTSSSSGGGIEGAGNAASQDIKVIGRLPDTAVARDWEGHDVLNSPNWSLDVNDAWVNEGIKNKQTFYLASPTTEENLVSSNPMYPGETVYAREIRMLQEAGYKQQGEYLYPPKKKLEYKRR